MGGFLYNDSQPQPDPRFGGGEHDSWAGRRESMVRDQIQARGVRAPGVLQAMRRIPRHAFVPAPDQAMAYEDSALPIGFGQTISQPYIVGLMSELLAPVIQGPDSKILEAGTGSGYQAAILAEMGATVYTIEIVEPLAERTREIFRNLGYEKRIISRPGDAFQGWPEAAPFDGIVLTCAVPVIPPALIDQLKPGGRLVGPVGENRFYQTLTLAVKSAGGEVHYRGIIGVVFVPMTGPHGLE